MWQKFHPIRFKIMYRSSLLPLSTVFCSLIPPKSSLPLDRFHLFERDTPRNICYDDDLVRGYEGLLAQPEPPRDDKAMQNDTLIHLSIAAFRDGPRCAQTILFAIKYARYAKRLRFTVLDQYTEFEPLCEDGFEAAITEYCQRDHTYIKQPLPKNRKIIINSNSFALIGV